MYLQFQVILAEVSLKIFQLATPATKFRVLENQMICRHESATFELMGAKTPSGQRGLNPPRTPSLCLT